MLYFKTSDSTVALDKTLSDENLLLKVITEISPGEREVLKYIFHLLNFQDKGNAVVTQDKKPTKTLKDRLRDTRREEKASIWRDFLILGGSPNAFVIFSVVYQDSKDFKSDNALDKWAARVPAFVFMGLVLICNRFELGTQLKYFVETESKKNDQIPQYKKGAEEQERLNLLPRPTTMATSQQRRSTLHSGTPTQEHRVEIDDGQRNKKRPRDDAPQSEPHKKRLPGPTAPRGKLKPYALTTAQFCGALRKWARATGAEFYVNYMGEEPEPPVRVDMCLIPKSSSDLTAFLLEDAPPDAEEMSWEQFCDYIECRLNLNDSPTISLVDCTGCGKLSAIIPRTGLLLLSMLGMARVAEDLRTDQANIE